MEEVKCTPMNNITAEIQRTEKKKRKKIKRNFRREWAKESRNAGSGVHPDEQYHGRDIKQKKKRNSADIELRSPEMQEVLLPKKGYLYRTRRLYRCTLFLYRSLARPQLDIL